MHVSAHVLFWMHYSLSWHFICVWERKCVCVWEWVCTIPDISLAEILAQSKWKSLLLLHLKYEILYFESFYLCIFIFLHCTFGHVLSCFPADARCCCFHAYGEMKRLFLSREFPRIGPSILFDFSKWITYETYQYNNNNNLKKPNVSGALWIPWCFAEMCSFVPFPSF